MKPRHYFQISLSKNKQKMKNSRQRNVSGLIYLDYLVHTSFICVKSCFKKFK